jgi:vacuolar-type H+-ATPase subunit I/STV1
MLGILGYVIWFVALACFILVLVKQFEAESVFSGLIGILTCGIWTFIWGWINAREEHIISLMLLWTLAVVIRLFGIVW